MLRTRQPLDWNFIHNDTKLDICDKILETLKNNENCTVNYLVKLNYCYFNKFQWISYLIIIIVIILCFYFLSSTGEEYLSQILTKLAKKCNCSQNLAGLTLLAFGDEAADIITAIVSAEDDDGIPKSLSALFGSASIVLGIIMSLVIFIGKNSIVNPVNYTRDLITYIIALSFVLIVGFYIEKFTIVVCSVFFSTYWIYVLICFMMDEFKNHKNELDDDLKGHEFKVRIERTFTCETLNLLAYENVDGEDELDSQLNLTEMNNKEGKEYVNEVQKIQINNENDKKLNNKIEKSFNLSHFLEQSYINSVSGDNKKLQNFVLLENKEYIYYNKFYYSLLVSCLNKEGEDKWEDKSSVKKIKYWIIDFPLDIIRYCTIPPYEESKWKRNCFIVMPICVLTLINIATVGFFSQSFLYYIISYSIALILSLIFYITTSRGRVPKYQIMLLTLALLMSIYWIYIIIEFLIKTIDGLAIIFPYQIDELFLMMTIIAFGNALPDLVVAVTLAKKNLPEMAISGSIGAPILSLFLGFGVSLLKKHIISASDDDDFEFKFNFHEKETKLILTAMLGLILHLLHLLVTGFCSKFKVKRYPSSIIGFIIFGVYFSTIIYITFFNK